MSILKATITVEIEDSSVTSEGVLKDYVRTAFQGTDFDILSIKADSSNVYEEEDEDDSEDDEEDDIKPEND